MNKQRCSQVQVNLEGLVSRTLDGELLHSLELHLEQCPVCRQLVQDCRDNSVALRELKRQSVPEGGIEAVLLARRIARLPRQDAPGELDHAIKSSLKSFVWGHSRAGRIFRFVASGTAAAASLILCLSMWLQTDSPDTSQKPHFVYRDVSAPLAGWGVYEADQVMPEGGRQR